VSDSPFINDDGYTETKFIKGVFGLYPNVRIEFRPLPPTDQAVEIEKLQKIAREGGAAKSEKASAERIAARLKSWQFVNDENKPVCDSPVISAASVAKLKPALFIRLMSVVFYGSDGGDRDPFGESDLSPTNERLEADLKN
jgi:hypothetical protein